MLDDVSVLTTGSAASRPRRRATRRWTPPATASSLDGRPASTRSDRSITSVSLGASFTRRKHRAPGWRPGTFGGARRFPPAEQRVAPLGGVELEWPSKTRRRLPIDAYPWLAPRRDDAYSFTKDRRVKLPEDGSLLSAWSPAALEAPGRPSLVSMVSSRCPTPVERRRQARIEATDPRRMQAASLTHARRRAARDVRYLYERRFEVPFETPCINGDNRHLTAPGNSWWEKNTMLPRPSTNTRCRHNVERPRANYCKRDGQPRRSGAARAKCHESKWYATLGLARTIAARG